jgi:hypothetical protein
MSHETLLIISLAFSFAAYPAYLYAIARDGARPTRPTWLMILVSDLLLFCFMLAEARWDWLLLGFTAGNIMTLVAMALSDLRASNLDALPPQKRSLEIARLALLGRDPWSKKDIASVAVALGAIGLWAVTGSGVMAICFSLAGKIAASVPMWINLYRDPTREPILPWLLWGTGGALYVMAIPVKDWSFVSLATPAVFLILECLVLALLARRYTIYNKPTPFEPALQ